MIKRTIGKRTITYEDEHVAIVLNYKMSKSNLDHVIRALNNIPTVDRVQVMDLSEPDENWTPVRTAEGLYREDGGDRDLPPEGAVEIGDITAGIEGSRRYDIDWIEELSIALPDLHFTASRTFIPLKENKEGRLPSRIYAHKGKVTASKVDDIPILHMVSVITDSERILRYQLQSTTAEKSLREDEGRYGIENADKAYYCVRVLDGRTYQVLLEEIVKVTDIIEKPRTHLDHLEAAKKRERALRKAERDKEKAKKRKEKTK